MIKKHYTMLVKPKLSGITEALEDISAFAGKSDIISVTY